MRRRLPLLMFLLAVFGVVCIATASAAAGPIGFSGSDPIDFGSQAVGSTSSATSVTVTNTGNQDLLIDQNGVTIGGANPGSFQLSNDSCSGATVPGGTSCSVDVQFAPVNGVGQYNATLNVLDSTNSVSGSTGLTGVGTGAPTADPSPGSLSFGNQKLGTTSSGQTVTLTNNGNVALHVSGVSKSGTDTASFQLSNDLCSGTTVAANDHCTVSVSFAPDGTGSKAATLVFSDDASDTPQNVTLSGNGAAPIASPSPALSFATAINGSDTKTITLTNSGDAPLVVDTALLTGDATFTKIVTATPCGGSTVAPGAHCTVDIKFSPTSTTAQNATLTFTDDSGGTAGSKQAVSITGTTLIPGISSNPPSLSFEVLPVGRLSSPITATITNTGQANLHITSVAIGGLNYKSFQLGIQTCTQAPIAPGDPCTVNVKFSPTKLGARVATLLVRNDAGGSASTLNVALTGTGVRPPSVTALRAATGCTDVRLTWRNPTAVGFVRVQVVRNSAHTPKGPFDGTIVKHTTGALTDTGLNQFQSYHYALYAVYTSFDHSRLVFSAADAAAVRTGRICRPRNGSLISDLSPAVDWTPYSGAHYYAYILQRFGHTILVRYPKRSETTVPSSWTFNGQSKSIQHGGVYSFYLYAYTSGRPRGFLIGQTVFTEQ